MRLPRPTYANVISSLALFIALGGTSVAVITAHTSAACSGHARDCTGLNLDGRKFERLDLTRSIWNRASLVGASFYGSDLYGSSFDSANLTRANLTHGNRTQSDFHNARLGAANLTSGDFWGSDMRGVDFRGATFNGTKMDRTDLSGANLTGATIRNSSFHDVHYCRTIWTDGSVRNNDC